MGPFYAWDRGTLLKINEEDKFANTLNTILNGNMPQQRWDSGCLGMSVEFGCRGYAITFDDLGSSIPQNERTRIASALHMFSHDLDQHSPCFMFCPPISLLWSEEKRLKKPFIHALECTMFSHELSSGNVTWVNI